MPPPQETRSFFRNRRWFFAAAVGTLLLGGAIATTWWLNPRLTRYVESDAFRQALEKETTKGLHFESGRYAAIRRTGFLTAESSGFRAANGRKTLTAIDARGISVKFNPLGVFLRRWQLDDVHIRAGEVGIQTYEPTPEPSPAKPWFAIFLPERVYLRHVESEPVDVTWHFLGEKGGFFDTKLLITPHRRDFEYRASGGTFRLAFAPDLQVRATHLYVTHDVMKIYNIDLASGAKNPGVGTIHAQGEAQLKGNKSIAAYANFAALPIEEWAPASWRGHLSGAASGEINYRSENTSGTSSSGEASLRVDGGRIARLPFLDKLASITGKRALETLSLDDCALEVDWHYPRINVKRVALEEKGKLRIEGGMVTDKGELEGVIRLGATREYLTWLPNAEKIFSDGERGYLWTTVHVSGTLKQPKEDLTPRVEEALKESPGAAIHIFLREIADWLRRSFGG